MTRGRARKCVGGGGASDERFCLLPVGFVWLLLGVLAVEPSSGGFRAESADAWAVEVAAWVDMLAASAGRRWVDDRLAVHSFKCEMPAPSCTGENARVRSADIDATDEQELQQRVATMNLRLEQDAQCSRGKEL